MTYQSPEIVEIGQAAEMTLGFTNKEVPDGCDCTKCSCTGIEDGDIGLGTREP